VSSSTAQAFELLFLEYAQPHELQGLRNIAYFIQKERALIGQLKTADFFRNGAGERAFLVAEKLAFQEIERNGGAVQLYKRTSAARADIVNCARDQLLACCCFSLDENS